MRRHEDSLYLQHVLEAIAKIETYLDGVDRQAFLDQSLIQDGVIRRLEIIGEAVKRLSFPLRETRPHIPWQDIAGMRDKFIHGYFGVDLEQVWLTATTDIPLLRQEVSALLAELETG